MCVLKVRKSEICNIPECVMMPLLTYCPESTCIVRTDFFKSFPKPAYSTGICIQDDWLELGMVVGYSTEERESSLKPMWESSLKP